MSRGTGTKKLLNEATVSKALKGDKATLDELARKGGNKGSSKSDVAAAVAPKAPRVKPLTPEQQDARNKILTTPVPNEEALAKALGVPVETVRMMHSQVEKLYPESGVAQNAKAIKDAEAKAKGGKPEEEPEPWYMKKGSGFWNLLHERGRGSTNEMLNIGGGGEEKGGGPSVADLIKKKVVITGKPPVPAVPTAPSAPSPGA